MFLSRRAPELPTPDQALRGRETPAFDVPDRHTVLGNPLLGPYPEGLEIADFGLGCFWGAERKFWQTHGVWTTLVGYQGGYTQNPAYEEVCSGLTGHTEAVRVVFDPSVVSYEQLLKVFWESHDPTQGFRQGNDVGTQYRSAIYTHSPSQATTAAGLPRGVPAGPDGLGLRHDHDGTAPGGGPPVLPGGGVPPAVPGQEPGGVLRHRRDGRQAKYPVPNELGSVLPDGHRAGTGPGPDRGVTPTPAASSCAASADGRPSGCQREVPWVRVGSALARLVGNEPALPVEHVNAHGSEGFNALIELRVLDVRGVDAAAW